ncbi:MAG: EAL domain-containing protein [Eubacteriales bacterium]|nr:EAL domain-containing protein [Eubacteriales bacterium]
MKKLSDLCAARDNSPIGFALVEVIYENDNPIDFIMRYINQSSETILDICTETVDKNFYKTYPDTNPKWLASFHDCLNTSEKIGIQDFAKSLGKYLQIDCFPCGKNLCGCFIRDITKEMLIVHIQLEDFNKNLITREEKALLEIVKRYASHNKKRQDANQNEISPAVNAMIDENSRAMSMFNDCIELVSKNVSIEETFYNIIGKICRFFEARSGSIELYTGHSMKISWTENLLYESSNFPGVTSAVCLKELSEILRGQTYVSIPDTTDNHIPEAYRTEWSKNGIKSICLIPIFSKESLIGFVSLSNIYSNLSQIHIINMIIKITESIIQNAKLREENVQLQYSDSLTGHFNFEWYKQIAASILQDSPGKKYALCNCDIIRFKYINDMFGYNVGDKLLKYWADLINEDLREGETFCRVSADNMVALRCYEDIRELEKRFYQILSRLNEFPDFKNRKINVDVVSGIYLLDQRDISEPDINRIIDKAGIARNSAKGIGSKVAYYDNAMRERQLWELQVCQNLLERLKENQFSVCFQPQYDYHSGNIIGAEALVRWNHPVFGRILPNDFIPVLEKNGLIGKLDLFVWEEACKLIRHMLNNSDKLPMISIAVNVSRLDICMHALKDELLNILEKYSLSPSMLHLEITEGAYIENSDLLIEVVEELRDCGFNIHMDDFGTGFSSLNILKDVPVNVLKLDMKFLSAEKNPERGGNILSSIVGMANHIGLSVIAEGVETRKQADYLKSLGCRYMQGYYFAKPMSVDKFKEYLKDKKSIQIKNNF